MSTNLTEAAFYTRKALKIGAVFIVAILVVRGTWQVTGKIITMLKPPPKEEPDYKFGTRLTAIQFPTPPTIPPLSFQLETIDQKLPVFPEIQNVYFIPINVYSLLTLEDAKIKAAAYDFKGESSQLQGASETTYQWRKGAEIGSTLTMRIITQNFDFRYEYEKDQAMLNSGRNFDEKSVISEANNFLRKGGFLHGDLAGGLKTTVYYQYDPNGLEKVYSILDADFIRVNYQRTNINELPVLSANPNKTNVSLLVSKSSKQPVVEAGFNYYPITTSSVATYPIRPAVDAWNELKDGRAFIADLGDNQSGQVKITHVYLAYFDPASPQNYLQPIYVFDGINGFRAFVPALSPSVTQATGS